MLTVDTRELGELFCSLLYRTLLVSGAGTVGTSELDNM